MGNIYNEAIADAKRLKEVAEKNATNKVIESIAPRIRQLIEQEINDDLEDELDFAAEDDLGQDFESAPDESDLDDIGSDPVSDLGLVDAPLPPISSSL